MIRSSFRGECDTKTYRFSIRCSYFCSPPAGGLWLPKYLATVSNPKQSSDRSSTPCGYFSKDTSQGPEHAPSMFSPDCLVSFAHFVICGDGRIRTLTRSVPVVDILFVSLPKYLATASNPILLFQKTPASGAFQNSCGDGRIRTVEGVSALPR